MPFCFCPLRSGSSGNAVFAQADGVRVLIDAGLSGRAVECALAEIGVTPDSLSAILITHEHSDHIQGAGVLSRRWNLPVYATEGTWLAMENKACVRGVSLPNRIAFSAGDAFYIGNMAIEPFSIPHDAADPVGFSLLAEGRKVCVATDLGHISRGWMQAVNGADLILLEANHDPDLLRRSTRYHSYLKKRILGRKGHLSNDDSGSALVSLAEGGLRHVILGHMSQETNTPEIAFQTVCAALSAAGIRPGGDVQVDLAFRDRLGGVYEIG